MKDGIPKTAIGAAIEVARKYFAENNKVSEEDAGSIIAAEVGFENAEEMREVALHDTALRDKRFFSFIYGVEYLEEVFELPSIYTNLKDDIFNKVKALIDEPETVSTNISFIRDSNLRLDLASSLLTMSAVVDFTDARSKEDFELGMGTFCLTVSFKCMAAFVGSEWLYARESSTINSVIIHPRPELCY